jgi:hypothetical protein
MLKAWFLSGAALLHGMETGTSVAFVVQILIARLK